MKIACVAAKGIPHGSDSSSAAHVIASIERVPVNQLWSSQSHTIFFRELRELAANLIADCGFRANRRLLLTG